MREIALSVISPVLNEEFFLPLYLEAVSAYAGEILLLDGGSTDRTLDIIRDYQSRLAGAGIRLDYWQMPQKGRPYSQDWQEGQRRNFLLKQARGKWVLALDIDEYLSDNFAEVFQKEILPERESLTFGFAFIPFWKSVSFVRQSVLKDPHWEGNIYRLVRRKVASYDLKGNHSLLLCRGELPYLCQKRRLIKKVSLFHYHYALGERFKVNDNRRGDLGVTEGEGRPDWDYRPPDHRISLRPFNGEHPRVIRDYLSGGEGRE